MKSRLKSKKFIIGSVILTIGICLMISIPLYFLQSHASKTELLKEYNKQEHHLAQKPQNENQRQLPVPKEDAIQKKSDDGLLGKIVIQKLTLEVPIVEGTDNEALKKGAGHLSTSVAAGENGTSVIAAHNTTFFHRLGELKVKDTFQVETPSGTKKFEVYQTKIVKTGDAIYNTETPSVVLETCYPFDAISRTPYRYLVYAKIIN